MNLAKHSLLLADDDIDDRAFFEEALDELALDATLTTVSDGAELMQLLYAIPGNLPDVLFLDLNMPRKTGLECLAEIKLHKALRNLPVVIFSTSLDRQVVNDLYDNGAHYYIRKPAAFSHLKQLIQQALSLISTGLTPQPSKENFVLNTY